MKSLGSMDGLEKVSLQKDGELARSISIIEDALGLQHNPKPT